MSKRIGPCVVSCLLGLAACKPSGLLQNPTAAAPHIQTGTLPTAIVGVSYSAAIAVGDGTLPLSWSINAPAELAWLTVDETTGALSGTPTKPIRSGAQFTAEVKDASQRVDSKTVTLVVQECEPAGQKPACGTSEECSTDGTCVLPSSGDWVTVNAGTFQMGSPDTELGRPTTDINETLHSVTLTHDFVMLSTEVTRGEFKAQMTADPSGSTACIADNCPVETVTWDRAAFYCNSLSALTGRSPCYFCTGSSGGGVSCAQSAAYATPYDCPGYRLPTEAEWEYAARAGTTTATYNGDLLYTENTQPNDVLDPIAWFGGDSGSTTHAVAQKTANTWGLYDMLGNVWEWCHDVYAADYYSTGGSTDPWGPPSGTGHTTRGGSYAAPANFARAAARYLSLSTPDDTMGFRPVRSLP
jgi:formylglycine-generating enzyme required for sulfatase activity